MCKNCEFVVPVNILTPFLRAPFSWAIWHTTVYLDLCGIVGSILSQNVPFNVFGLAVCY